MAVIQNALLGDPPNQATTTASTAQNIFPGRYCNPKDTMLSTTQIPPSESIQYNDFLFGCCSGENGCTNASADEDTTVNMTGFLPEDRVSSAQAARARAKAAGKARAKEAAHARANAARADWLIDI